MRAVTVCARKIPVFTAASTQLAHRCLASICEMNEWMNECTEGIKNSLPATSFAYIPMPWIFTAQTYKGELSCTKWDKKEKRGRTLFTIRPALLLSEGKRRQFWGNSRDFQRETLQLSLAFSQWMKVFFKHPESHFLQPEWNLGSIQYYWAEERFISQLSQLFRQENWGPLTSRTALVFLIPYDVKKNECR